MKQRVFKRTGVRSLWTAVREGTSRTCGWVMFYNKTRVSNLTTHYYQSKPRARRKYGLK